jgi:hypothetical protein
MPTAEGTEAGHGMGQAGGVVSVFVNNAAVRLHVLDNGRVCAPPPVLVVPGMGEYADVAPRSWSAVAGVAVS